jgi:uroporphyrinogen decarboxylase
MNNNFLAALSCKQHDTIPLWELEFHLWGKFSDKPFFCGIDFEKLAKKEKEKAIQVNAEIIIEVSSELGFSAITIPGSYWELAPGVPAYYWLPQIYRIQLVKKLKDYMPENICLVANTGGVLAIPDAANYVEFSCKLFEEPEEIDKNAQLALQNGIENINRWAGLGVNVMLTASDLADNKGPYFNSEQMNRFILPYLQNWVEEVKRVGANSILHTDGNINFYLELLSESGVNAIQSIDPVAGMDMEETLKRIQNRTCLCGNIDCGLLLTSSPEIVFQETKKLLKKVRNYPGFVLGASNAVQPEVPKENYLAMSDALKQLD